MQDIYIYAIAAILVLLLIGAVRSPERFFEYPYFMAATFVVFICPQIVSLTRQPGSASSHAVESVLLMTLLCVLSCVLGYRPIGTLVNLRRGGYRLDEQKLAQMGVIYLLTSWLFMTLLGRLDPSEAGGSMMTGKATIYLFFASVIYIAIAILLRNALRIQDNKSWLLFGISLIPPIQAAIFAGRRESTVHLLIAIAMTLYFERRWVPPRFATFGAILFATLAIPATGAYRSIAETGDWSRLDSLDLVENFRQFVSEESILELRNAAMTIQAVSELDAYTFGVGYWDELVWRFVPAQLVGRDIKNTLMLERDTGSLHLQLAAAGYKIPVGSTLTGMGDSFVQFGYFGAIFFAIVGMLFCSLWQRAQRQHNYMSQLLYIGTFTSAMRSVTHQSVDLLPGLVYQLVFVGIVYLVAKSPESTMHADL